MPASLCRTASCFRRSGDQIMAIRQITCECSSHIFEKKSNRIPRNPSTSSPNHGLDTGSKHTDKYSIVLFLIAGLFEIGGGYLVWQWWRNGSLVWIDCT